MIDLDVGERAVRLARSVVEEFTRTGRIDSDALAGGLPELFDDHYGAFVTINTHPSDDLRGCIGYIEPVYPLKKVIMEVGQSATRDPRFPPLDPAELANVVIEVSILTPPEPIPGGPDNYANEIVIGRDGLIAESGYHRGLLLPQVATDYNWDAKTFLSHTCMKAELQPDSWRDGRTKFLRFSATVFAETEPGGEVVRREIGQ